MRSTTASTASLHVRLRGSGTGIQLEAAWKTYRGVKPILPKVFVQRPRRRRPVGKVSGARGKIGKDFVMARAPAYVVTAGVAAQTVDYRLKTKKLKKGPAQGPPQRASEPVTVSFDNQAMYTGDQARFYAPIAQLCPNANIHLDTTNITGTTTPSSAGSTASPSTPPRWPPTSTSPRSPSWASPSTSART